MKLLTVVCITNTITGIIIFFSCCAFLEIKYDWSKLTAAESNWLVAINNEAFWVVSIAVLSFCFIITGLMLYAFLYTLKDEEPQQKKRQDPNSEAS